MNNPDLNEQPAACPPLADTTGSAFLLRREAYPDYFRGFNQHGACWTSAPKDALHIPGDRLAVTIGVILADKRGKANELAVTYAPNAKVRDGR